MPAENPTRMYRRDRRCNADATTSRERLLLRGRLDREACSRVRDTAFRGSWRKDKGGEREREYGLRGLTIDRWNRGGFRDKEGIFDPWTILNFLVRI